MPKMKTKSGAKKRFTLTGTGKVKRGKAYHSHQLGVKTQKQKKRLVKSTILEGKDAVNVKRMLAKA